MGGNPVNLAYLKELRSVDSETGKDVAHYGLVEVTYKQWRSLMLITRTTLVMCLSFLMCVLFPPLRSRVTYLEEKRLFTATGLAKGDAVVASIWRAIELQWYLVSNHCQRS